MLAGWKVATPYARIANTVPAGIDAAVERINTPDKANATVAAGMYVPLQDTAAEYPAVVLANRVIGGSATSRLWMRLREKEGYSYGVRSNVNASPFEPFGQFSASAICNPANAEKARAAAVEEIARFLAEGTTAEELQKAKDAYLQARLMGRTQEPALAGMIASHLYTNRTFEYDAKLDEAVRALTPEQVLAAAKKYIDPAKLVVILAGDFGKDAGKQ